YDLSFKLSDTGANKGMWVFNGSDLIFWVDASSIPQYHGRQFIATSDQTMLTFRALGSSYNGPALDDVSVQFVRVPEPSSVAISLLGVCAAVAIRLRNHSRKH